MKFLKYILKKILILVLSLLLISIVIHLLFEILPGNPIIAKVGVENDNNQALINMYKEQFNLDKTVLQRYGIWLKDILFGDWGTSFYFTNTSVKSLIFSERLITTLSLITLSIISTVIISVPLSLFIVSISNSAKVWKKRLYNVITFLTQIAIALPSFWVGILLLTFFAVKLNIFPVSTAYVDWTMPLATINALFLPVLTISIGTSAYTIRYLTNFLEVESTKDYMLIAKAKGLSDFQALKNHALHNSLVPLITVFSLILISLITGTVIIENLYSLSGLGSLLIDAINNQDYPLIQGIVLFYSALIIIITFITDILYGVINPKIRR